MALITAILDCVSGTITKEKGKAAIKVSDPSQIRIMED